MIKRLLPDGISVKIIEDPYLPIVLVEGCSGLQLMYQVGNSWYDNGKRVFLRDDSCLVSIYEDSLNLGSD